MHVLLDENLPVELARELEGHEVRTVSDLGWQGVANGDLLRRASGLFDCLVTLDRSIDLSAEDWRGEGPGQARVASLSHVRPGIRELLTG